MTKAISFSQYGFSTLLIFFFVIEDIKPSGILAPYLTMITTDAPDARESHEEHHHEAAAGNEDQEEENGDGRVGHLLELIFRALGFFRSSGGGFSFILFDGSRWLFNVSVRVFTLGLGWFLVVREFRSRFVVVGSFLVGMQESLVSGIFLVVGWFLVFGWFLVVGRFLVIGKFLVVG